MMKELKNLGLTQYLNKASQPSVVFYTGRKCVEFLKTEFSKLKKTNAELIFRDEKKSLAILNPLFSNTQLRLIYIKNKKSAGLEKLFNITQLHRLDPRQLDLAITLLITPQKIIIFRFAKSLAGLEIKDRVIAKSFRNMFEVFWKIAD